MYMHTVVLQEVKYLPYMKKSTMETQNCSILLYE